MTQEKIFTGNSLLADFFGFQKTNLGWYDSEEILNIKGDNTFDSLEFDSSIEWQFAAAKQLGDMIGNLLIEQNNGEHKLWDEWSEMVEDLVYFNDRIMLSTDIDGVFQDIVKTVEWYQNAVEKEEKMKISVKELYLEINNILTPDLEFEHIDGDKAWARWRNMNEYSDFDIELFGNKDEWFGCIENVDADEISEWHSNNLEISDYDRELFSKLVQLFLANGYKYGQSNSDGTVFDLSKNGCYVYFIIHTDGL